MEELPNFLKPYKSFILNLNPPIWWKILRFLLHWITLPLKLIVIGVVTIAMIGRNFFQRRRKLADLPDFNSRKYSFRHIYNRLPIYDNGQMNLYVNRVPYNSLPDGINHNDDHQGARHGTFAFLLNKLGIFNSKVDRATSLHFAKHYGVVRGYKFDIFGNIKFNGQTTSGDQLLGLCLAMLETKDLICKEEFELAVDGIINNDYAIKESNGLIKSDRGMWQPGLETVGAQALTILAALSISAKLGSKNAKKHYKKLIWLYGYGLLSIFPTTFLPSHRNYFNDHNCIISSYILARNASNKLSKFFWTMVAYGVWAQSFNWYNGYFTGLIRDLNPALISKSYLAKCKQYIYEEIPVTYSRGYSETKTPDAYPVKFNNMNQGEFHPDEPHLEITREETHYKYRSGLGWLAHAVMIDPEEAKEFLK